MTTKKIEKNLLVLSTVAILGLGLISFTSINTNAQDTSTNTETSIQGQFRRGFEGATEFRTALDNNDFDAWKEAVAESSKGEKLLEIIDTDEEFAKLVEAHGYIEKAREIREELGINFKEQAKEKIEAVKEAIENEDYETWKSLVAESPKGEKMLEIIDTEEKFTKLVEIHQAKQDGDKEKAKSIAEELGLPGKDFRGGEGQRKGGNF